MDVLPSSAAAAEKAATDPLVFLRDKSDKHAPGCLKSGVAWVSDDGRAAPLRSKASNRCEACARAVSWENVTMLRQDAECNSAPGYVLTLTSSKVDWTPSEYRNACEAFWKAWRRRYGPVEYCGFIEWTTGEGANSGGFRRMHSHWLVKAPGLDLDPLEVQAWVSAEWKGLTGAWRVEFARLETVGGIVGYIALHHEKWEQRPPAGWTGRRLRPSKGYFAEPGHVRRARAKLWLEQYRHGQVDEHGIERVMPPASGRIVSKGRTYTEAEGVRSSRVLDTPGRSFNSLPSREALDRRLLDPRAPIHADPMTRAEDDLSFYRWVADRKHRSEVLDRWEKNAREARQARRLRESA